METANYEIKKELVKQVYIPILIDSVDLLLLNFYVVIASAIDITSYLCLP